MTSECLSGRFLEKMLGDFLERLPLAFAVARCEAQKIEEDILLSWPKTLGLSATARKHRSQSCGEVAYRSYLCSPLLHKTASFITPKVRCPFRIDGNSSRPGFGSRRRSSAFRHGLRDLSDLVKSRFTPTPSGQRTHKSIAFVAAAASIVPHSTCIPQGSRDSTARCELQLRAHSSRITVLASPDCDVRSEVRELRLQ
mgnify:CR=1 FL=1